MITKPSPPSEIVNALRDGLPENEPLLGILTGDEKGEREVLQVNRVGLKDVASGNWRQQQSVGWRFLAADGNKSGIIVNVAAGANGQPPRVSAVRRGAYVLKIIEKVRNVPVPSPAAASNVELVVLDIPGLVEMFWFRGNGPEDGWTVSYNTLVRELAAQPFYAIADFFATAKAIAVRRLQQGDGLPPNTMTSG